MDLAMPRLSDTMEEGTLGRWLKHEGETIEKGEVIAEIQTDKANMELEAFEGGVLERILVQEGETVPIGQAIAVIGSGANGGTTSAPARAVDAEKPAAAREPEAGPAAAPQPGREGGPSARMAQAPQRQATGPEGRIKASPMARRLAQEQDLELTSIHGTGPNGRVTRDDVLKAAAAAPAAEPAQAPQPETRQPAAAPELQPATTDGDVTPFTRIQGIIARRMVESKTQAPHIYLTVEIDMAKAIQLRRDVNALGGQNVSFNDIVIKACAAALRAYPRANRSYAEGSVRRNAQVNVGFAVGLEDNLLVPVIRDADKKSLRQIAAEARDLIGRAREGKLSASELSGGTFTVSNLGMYGVEEFGAIINQPESAILAVGAIARKPVVEDDRIVAGDRMRVTLSADHRVLYGTDAAEFLRELKRLLEEPLNIGF